jgi:hypothetical protein
LPNVTFYVNVGVSGLSSVCLRILSKLQFQSQKKILNEFRTVPAGMKEKKPFHFFGLKRFNYEREEILFCDENNRPGAEQPPPPKKKEQKIVDSTEQR